MTRLVIHADDVGFCHGANVAFVELSRAGALTAGSVMVPCPWFPEIAAAAADDPSGELDLGVHLTLTSEHRYYRWAPLTRPSAAAGLTGPDGYMWPTVAQVRANAHPDAVEAEWRAQIERALAAGVDVTHLDAHMGAALAPEWAERYVALGVKYRIPALITTTFAAYDPNDHLAGTTAEQWEAAVAIASAAGMPVFTRVLETDFGRPAGAAVDYRAHLHSDQTELVYCAYHPCAPGDVEQIDAPTFHVRTDEYALFGTDEWHAWLAAQPFELVSMRTLRDGWRAGADGARPADATS